MVRPAAGLYSRVRHHGPELVKFGIVGGLGTVIDLGGAAVLHSAYHEGPLESKALSISAAAVFTYLGSRYWTFRHRDNQPVHREVSLFVALNAVGLVVAELVIAGTTYGLGLKGQLAYNAASLAGTGLGTVFRWFAYRKWVFLAPEGQPAQPAPRPEPAAFRAPWELDPARAAHPGQRGLDSPFIPNARVAPPLLTAPVPAGSAPGPAPYAPGPAYYAPGREPYSAGPPPYAAPASPAPPAPRPGPAGPRGHGRHRKR